MFVLWLSMSRGDLLTLPKPKSEALGGLGTIAKALNFLESGHVGLIKFLRLINNFVNKSNIKKRGVLINKTF